MKVIISHRTHPITPDEHRVYEEGQAFARSGRNVVGQNPYRFSDRELAYFWDLGWVKENCNTEDKVADSQGR